MQDIVFPSVVDFHILLFAIEFLFKHSAGFFIHFIFILTLSFLDLDQYINNFLLSHKDIVNGRCLEIGAAEYCEMLGVPETHTYVLGANVCEGGRNIPGDLSDMSTLPDIRFDTFICTQTLNFIFDFEAAIGNAFKLINPGGHFIGTVSGVSQVSLYDAARWGDFYRFSPDAISRHLRKHFSVVEVVTYGNHYALMNYLTGHSFKT